MSTVRRNADGDGFVTEVTTAAGYLMELHLLEEAGKGLTTYELTMDVRSAWGTMDGLSTKDVRAMAAALINLAEKAELWRGKPNA